MTALAKFNHNLWETLKVIVFVTVMMIAFIVLFPIFLMLGLFAGAKA